MVIQAPQEQPETYLRLVRFNHSQVELAELLALLVQLQMVLVAQQVILVV